MKIQEEKFERNENDFILFEAHNMENPDPKKIVFSKTKIDIYKKDVLERSEVFQPPFLLKLYFGRIRKDYYFIVLSNFENEIVGFRWNNVRDFPLITDAFSHFYNLKYLGGSSKVLYGSEVMIFHSTEGKTSRKIYRLNKSKKRLKFTFSDEEKSQTVIDLVNKQMRINSVRLTTIDFDRIAKIVIYLKKIKNESRFSAFSIKVLPKTGNSIIVLELDKIFGLYTRSYELQVEEVNGSWIFNAAIELMNLLKDIPELKEIDVILKKE